MVFGERLKRLREGRYSQEELADMLHIHNNTISKWENGTQEPRAKRVTELARILGTTTAYLLGDTEDPSMNAEIPRVVEKEQHTQERNSNMAVVTLKDGNRIEAPATPEGYAFLERMFLASMSQPAAV